LPLSRYYNYLLIWSIEEERALTLTRTLSLPMLPLQLLKLFLVIFLKCIQPALGCRMQHLPSCSRFFHVVYPSINRADLPVRQW
jgi:hypothetical protein